jgi:probable phosphoglycerate mutase
MTDSISTEPTQIFLVRHGESLANAGGVPPDHITNPLTERGHAQAKEFADSFNCTPTLILQSPFLRARQTAEPFLQRFADVPVEEWPIEEFTYLEAKHHHGTSEEQQMPHILKYWELGDPAYVSGPGAESFTQFLDRVREAMRRLAGMGPGACVVVFTHGFFIQAFRMLLLFPGAADAQLMANFRRFHFDHYIENADSLEFEVREGKIELVGQLHLNAFSLSGETPHA